MAASEFQESRCRANSSQGRASAGRFIDARAGIGHVHAWQRELTLAGLPLQPKAPQLFPDYANFDLAADAGLGAKATTRPMESARFGGGLDNVGGPMLTSLLAQTRPYGNVASAGLAGSPTLEMTVMPASASFFTASALLSAPPPSRSPR